MPLRKGILMSNHTPGPWITTTWETTTPEGRFETYASVQHPLEDGGYIFICDCWGLEDEETHGVRLPSETAKANARLIAAAPKMLQALEDALRLVIVYGIEYAAAREMKEVHPVHARILEQIKNALTSARGCERGCPVDGMVCDGCVRVRTPCVDATEIDAEEQARRLQSAVKTGQCAPEMAAQTIRMLAHRTFGAPFFMGKNGPTGHGDICHSDADPGL